MSTHGVAADAWSQEALSSGDPAVIRAAAAEAVRRHAEARVGVFYSLVDTPDGPHMRNVILASPEPATRLRAAQLHAVDTRGELRACLPDPRKATSRESRMFLDSTRLWGDRQVFAARALTRWQRTATGLDDQVRLLVFSGERFVGWLGAFRCVGDPDFVPRDSSRLAAGVEPLTAALAAADALEHADLPTAPAFIVASPHGRVLHASVEATPWLQHVDFRADLIAAVRTMDVERRATATLILWCTTARVTRLSGDGASSYLVCVDPPSHLARDRMTTLLSPTQQKVAELLVAGARRKEIAAALGVGTETVRSHVRAVYERLGVSDRQELTRALGSAPTRPSGRS